MAHWVQTGMFVRLPNQLKINNDTRWSCVFYRGMLVQWNWAVSAARLFGVSVLEKNLSVHQRPLSTEARALHWSSLLITRELVSARNQKTVRISKSDAVQRFEVCELIPPTWELSFSKSLKYATSFPSSVRISSGQSPFIMSSRAECTCSQKSHMLDVCVPTQHRYHPNYSRSQIVDTVPQVNRLRGFSIFTQQTWDSVALKAMGFVGTPAQTRVKVSMLLLPFVTSATVMLVSEPKTS